jgi:cytochrome oxidase Cu insertion factor (SCO1/SenC/PrrC family)
MFHRTAFPARLFLALSLFATALSGAGEQAHAAQKRVKRGAPSVLNAGDYSCPMHPEVLAKTARKCPQCGMKLVKREPPASASSTGQGAANANKPEEKAETPLVIPDTPVLDQNGQPRKFYQDLVKGRTVAINFIFTTCAGVCPTLTAKFRQLQQRLAARGSEAHLISITVDPATDVPERLKDYAAKFKAGPGWTFVTGSKPEIDALLAALGAAAPDKTGHPSTALILNDDAGYRTRASALAPAATLADLVLEAAGKSPQTPVAQSGANAPLVADAKTAEASAKYFPHHVLLTQDNQPVRFYDDLLKGKVVIINFMFTTCAGVCSPMTANLVKAQNYLGARVGKEVTMLSISVDPLTDTPDVLKEFAAKHKVGPGWYFLTGKKENVDWVLYKLGGYTDDKAKHTSVLIIGNEATGRWIKTHAMAKPSEIADAVVKLIGQEEP